MKITKHFVVVLLFLSGVQALSAQTTDAARQTVVSRLREIKPSDTKEYVYKIRVPQTAARLPESLRLDFVYKIGHYEFRYVALRFEKKKGEEFVRATRFVYGSALNFWREYSKYKDGDGYVASEGKLAAKDFDELLRLANLFYQSNIEEAPVPQKLSKGSGIGIGSTTASWSSADGSIAMRLSDRQSNSIINDKGTLFPGDLKRRSKDGYEKMRVHLFWKVFDDYLGKNDIFTDLDRTQAEEIALARLAEPPFDATYADYYRQAVYVEILGEMGTAKALPLLKKLSENNSLEKNWNKYLSEDARAAIEKINRRE